MKSFRRSFVAMLAVVSNISFVAAALAADRSEERAVRYVHVPLPITSAVDANVQRTISGIVGDASVANRRPMLVLEFSAKEGNAGEATEMAHAFSLARFLISDRLNGARTIAYLPRTVHGHAVLPILACEEIIAAANAELGDAGVDAATIDDTVRRVYQDIAGKRRTIPLPVVAGMLDRESPVFRAQTTDGVRYVNQKELDELQQKGLVTTVDTVVPPGAMGKFTGREMRMKFGFVSHLADDRIQLASALGVSVQDLEADPSQGRPWKSLRIDLHGPIHNKSVNWMLRSLSERMSGGDINFLWIDMDSSGGSFADSLRLADFVANLPKSDVRTVAFISGVARADAALIAFACDHIVMSDGAVLGGPGDSYADQRELVAIRESLRNLASVKQIDWGLSTALVDPSLVVHRYTRVGSDSVRILADEEFAKLEQPQNYVRGSQVETRDGLKTTAALELKVARFQANESDQFRQLYRLDEDPDTIKPNWAFVLIEHLADPGWSGLLLVIAFVAAYIEFMTPGFSGAGFVSFLCFLLFFWAHFLHGTAGWLEVLLFLAGVACVLMEIFVVPGFGVFGIGGGFLIVVSIVLASQTFVIPHNVHQFKQLPNSMLLVVIAGGIALAAIGTLRRYLPNTPVLNRMMIPPPNEAAQHEIERRETIADYSFLVGKDGVATSQLLPGGKARIGDFYVDVLSDGEVIEAGTKVRVVQARGHQIHVRALT